VAGRSNGSRVNLSGEEEGGRVGSELGEERGEVVDGLESVDVRGSEELLVVESGDGEEELRREREKVAFSPSLGARGRERGARLTKSMKNPKHCIRFLPHILWSMVRAAT